MNVNIYYTKSYKNEPAVRRKKTNPNKANVANLCNLSPRDLFDHIEIFVFKTKLKILILQDRLDILLINKALRLIR